MANKNKVLPNFLGIGTTKSGTTWLTEILKSHPQIYLPPDKKEIHFFDKFYDKGLDWYKQFFPEKEKSLQYKAIGEFTPTYLNTKCAERIKNNIPSAKFITILRDPAQRTYSAFKYSNLHKKREKDLEGYLEKVKKGLGSNIYSLDLKNWINEFGRKKLLILIYEELKSNPKKELKKIADFLGVDQEKFDEKIINKYYNQTFVPRNKKFFLKGRNLIHKLRSKNWDKLANLIKKAGLPLISKKKTYSPPGEKDVKKLKDFYREEIKEVEKIIEKEIPAWKK